MHLLGFAQNVTSNSSATNLLRKTRQNTKVVFWEGWNKEAFALVSEMLKSGAISREPCHFFNYLVGGKFLTLPLVKRYTAYKTENWLPCLFVLGKCSK